MIDSSVRTLLLIRHGQYLASEDPAVHGGGLTDLGREQAQITADFCRNLSVNAIHHSTLKRAVQTAEIIALSLPDVPVTASDLLRECVPAVPPREQLSAQWCEWFDSFGMTSSEFAANAAQARKAYRWLFQNGEEPGLEIIVSSGNLISYLVARAFGAPAKSWIRTRVDLCSITAISVTSNRGPNPLVQSIGDTAHLPKHLRLFH